MMTERNNMLLLVIALLFSSCLWTNAQEYSNVNMCVEVDTLSSSFIRIELPCGYKKRIYNYEEGKFIDYFYNDGSIVTLFKGALQKTPLLANNKYYDINRIDTLNGKVIIRGTINDKVWREDSFEGIRVYYEKVPMDKMNLFDNILNSLLVSKVNSN